MDETRDETTPDIEVSFADVAAEEPEESVTHEAEATEVTGEPVTDEDAADHAAHEDNAAPTEPTISSLLGGGPVAGGSELAP